MDIKPREGLCHSCPVLTALVITNTWETSEAKIVEHHWRNYCIFQTIGLLGAMSMNRSISIHKTHRMTLLFQDVMKRVRRLKERSEVLVSQAYFFWVRKIAPPPKKKKKTFHKELNHHCAKCNVSLLTCGKHTCALMFMLI